MFKCFFMIIGVVVMITFYSSGQIQHDLNKVSEDLLLSTKIDDKKEIERALSILQSIAMNEIVDQLNSDHKKKSFWINIYNSFIVLNLSQDSSSYKNRSAFFKAQNITIAGHNFSFDFIEHGILRRSKVKLSLGFFGKLFPSKLERQLRVNKLDYRIHFALNCGASSCPPVAFYKAKEIDSQLDIAESSFVMNNTTFDKKKNTAHTSAIFSWFRADFGGKKGIRKIIRKHFNIKKKRFKMSFDKYDWTIDINNFETQSK